LVVVLPEDRSLERPQVLVVDPTCQGALPLKEGERVADAVLII